MILKDKTCLVTGATSGIGAEIALDLARLCGTVIVAGRDRLKCLRQVARIQKETGNTSVTFLLADLSSQADVRRLADEFKSKYERLDILINNAGGYFRKRQVSVDGIEMTFALNHLGYFLLTMLLLDRLKKGAPSRIINVASNAHRLGRIDFEDLFAEKSYDRHAAYAQSKLANILFTYELARRLKGSRVTVNALCPGSVRTNLGANNGWLRKKILDILDRNRIPADQGAKTPVYLATSEYVEGLTGKFFVNEKETRSSEGSYDEAVAERIWKVSEHLTGLRPNETNRLER